MRVINVLWRMIIYIFFYKRLFIKRVDNVCRDAPFYVLTRSCNFLYPRVRARAYDFPMRSHYRGKNGAGMKSECIFARELLVRGTRQCRRGGQTGGGRGGSQKHDDPGVDNERGDGKRIVARGWPIADVKCQPRGLTSAADFYFDLIIGQVNGRPLHPRHPPFARKTNRRTTPSNRSLPRENVCENVRAM